MLTSTWYTICGSAAMMNTAAERGYTKEIVFSITLPIFTLKVWIRITAGRNEWKSLLKNKNNCCIFTARLRAIWKYQQKIRKEIEISKKLHILLKSAEPCRWKHFRFYFFIQAIQKKRKHIFPIMERRFVSSRNNFRSTWPRENTIILFSLFILSMRWTLDYLLAWAGTVVHVQPYHELVLLLSVKDHQAIVDRTPWIFAPTWWARIGRSCKGRGGLPTAPAETTPESPWRRSRYRNTEINKWLDCTLRTRKITGKNGWAWVSGWLAWKGA